MAHPRWGLTHSPCSLVQSDQCGGVGLIGKGLTRYPISAVSGVRRSNICSDSTSLFVLVFSSVYAPANNMEGQIDTEISQTSGGAWGSANWSATPKVLIE